MKHQKQTHNACFPTTLAMLHDVDVSEVIAYGLEGTPYTKWSEAHRDKASYQKIVCKVLDKWYGPLCMGLGKFSEPNCSDICMGTSDPTPLPPGKGMITMRFMLIHGHVVAYENQMIYDGNRDEAVPWLTYYDQMSKRGWRFEEIRSVE